MPELSTLIYIVLVGGVALFAIIFLASILAKLYRRASKEISYVRTGAGGQKVIMNGGAMVIPMFQEVIPVNMNTLRLEVRRANEAALITRDRMRVDVQAEFYVRVKPTQEAIADAAQTLGRRTMNPQSLKELVEGKFVDALRAVAAEMAMEELHEQRVDFVQKVQNAVAEDLLKNGLELETVSLTSLDQTDKQHFNPDNAFDAQGLTRLTEQIEARRKQRNDVERDTQVAIEMKDLTTQQKSLEIQREEEYAQMMQAREVAVRRAAETTATAQEEAAKARTAEEAKIVAKQQVDQARIAADRAVEDDRIQKEQFVQEREIARHRAVETAEIERRKTIELAEQDRAIAVAEKSRAESEAAAEADKARALAAKAREQVTTAERTEVAEREKAIELVEAAKQAERDAIGITVAADAEKKAAIDRAEAARTRAQGDADKARITAEGDADAEIQRAQAKAKTYEVEAAGKRAINEADNTLSPALIAMQVKLETIRHLEGIIRESVKPMERIDDIKIIQVDGLGGNRGVPYAVNGNGHDGGDNGNSGGGGGGAGALPDQVVDAALRYRTQAPILESLLKEIGMAGSLNGLTQSVKANLDDSIDQSDQRPAKPDRKR